MTISFYTDIIQMIISVALIGVIMLQSKSIGLGNVFGGDSSFHKTRRGIDKTLHEATVGLALGFFLISILRVAIG
jgi:preprotein translocase subunit SecG